MTKMKQLIFNLNENLIKLQAIPKHHLRNNSQNQEGAQIMYV